MRAMTSRVRLTLATGLGLVGVAGAVFIGLPQVMQATSGASDSMVPVPALDEPTPASAASETAVLAGGCFWGVQGVFQHVKGVTEAESGYAGGSKDTADYDTVSTGSTGHAESVRITYDPSQVTFGQLLRIYFSVVTDPTQLNRQGPDEGTQYRSAIFAQDATQQRVADAYLAQLNAAKAFPAPIVTKVEPKHRVLPRRWLPPELPELEPHLPVHRDQRHAKGERAQAVVPGAVPRPTGAGPRQLLVRGGRAGGR
ncbi:MAG: peptide-methionine (S)-S-oxide reductase [Mycobacterium sp.]|nr:peptide-methionine (S)-S-oxide reductase [Mycobacterium sp.]